AFGDRRRQSAAAIGAVLARMPVAVQRLGLFVFVVRQSLTCHPSTPQAVFHVFPGRLFSPILLSRKSAGPFIGRSDADPSLLLLGNCMVSVGRVQEELNTPTVEQHRGKYP